MSEMCAYDRKMSLQINLEALFYVFYFTFSFFKFQKGYLVKTSTPVNSLTFFKNSPKLVFMYTLVNSI